MVSVSDVLPVVLAGTYRHYWETAPVLYLCSIITYIPGIRVCNGRFCDSLPPQTSDFVSLTNVSWLLDTRKDAMKKVSTCIFLFAKGYRTMTSGRPGAPYFR